MSHLTSFLELMNPAANIMISVYPPFSLAAFWPDLPLIACFQPKVMVRVAAYAGAMWDVF